MEYSPAGEERPEEKGWVKEEMLSAESHDKSLSDTIRHCFEKITEAAVTGMSVRGYGRRDRVRGKNRREFEALHTRRAMVFTNGSMGAFW